MNKKDKMVFLILVWGGTKRYGGVGRKSPPVLNPNKSGPKVIDINLIVQKYKP